MRKIPTHNDEEFEYMANRLQETKDWKGWTWRDISFASGYSAPYLLRLARGDRQPSREAAVKIAKALGVTPERLWGEDRAA